MKIHPRLLLLATLAALPAAALHAQTTNWTGNGGTASPGWADPTNWTNGLPPNDGVVVFGAASQTTSADNIATTTLDSMLFYNAAPTYNVVLLGGNNTTAGAVLEFVYVGIFNNSGVTQAFEVEANPVPTQGAELLFFNSTSIDNNVTIDNLGAGMTNGIVGVGGQTQFSNNATAGGASIFNYAATSIPGSATPTPDEGSTTFYNTTSAAGAQVFNQGAASYGATGGTTVFYNTATAGSALITNTGGTAAGAFGGQTLFSNSATAGGASIVNQPGTVSGAQGGVTLFTNSTSAGSATLIVDGGATGGVTSGGVVFENTSDGGTARMIFNAGGTLDISGLTSSGMNLGSIEGTASYGYAGQTITGAGAIYLGSKNLSVGGNDLSTTYNGTIADGGTSGGTGGSLTKTGGGILTLTGASTYTGGTVVSGGALLANNTVGSGTGSGAVVVSNGAALGGTGTVAGDVVVAGGAELFSGVVNADVLTPGILTADGNVGLSTNARLVTYIGGTAAGSGYGQVRFGGTLTLAGTLYVSVVNQFTLTPGMTFTILEGTGTGLVTGTFSNTTLGGTLYTDDNGDTFLVNYAASTDGGIVPNDVTLTVLTVANVPEPSTWALSGVGAGLLLVVRRRWTRCKAV